MTDTRTKPADAPGGSTPSRIASSLSHVVSDLGKNGIFLALIAVIVLFQVLTNGILLRPQNISNLIVQNGYILILAIGMVMVIVAGHIDLSVGSVAAFVGALSGVFAVKLEFPWWVAIILSLARRGAGRRLAGLLDRLRRDTSVHRDIGGHADLPRPRSRRAGQRQHRLVPHGVPRARQRLLDRCLRRVSTRSIDDRCRRARDRRVHRAGRAHPDGSHQVRPGGRADRAGSPPRWCSSPSVSAPSRSR